jgi:hypothetical protein
MRLSSTIAAVVVAASASVFANPVVIAPDESTSKDTFTYSAIPSGLPFGNATYLGASLESSGVHTVHSLIQFDLTGASVNANEAATFSIYARSKAQTPFSSVASDPSPTSPVTVDVYKITGAWDEASTTFSTEPTVDASAVTSFTVTNIGQYYSVDLTALVQSWIADPSSNFGIELRQRAVVTVPGAPDAAAVFQSSGAANLPTLAIAVVPEPMTLAGIGFVSMLVGRRRK